MRSNKFIISCIYKTAYFHVCSYDYINSNDDNDDDNNKNENGVIMIMIMYIYDDSVLIIL